MGNSIYIEDNINLVVERIGVDNLTKLLTFSDTLKTTFQIITGIRIGTYMVGAVTYPEKVYQESGLISDLDIIVAAYDRNYLKPFKTNSNRCPLTKELKKFFRGGYMDEFLTMDTSKFDFLFDELHSKTGKVSEHRHRPNVMLETQTGLPIHLTVQYKNPKIYGISMSRKDQLAYNDAIAKEIRYKNPFFIL